MRQTSLLLFAAILFTSLSAAAQAPRTTIVVAPLSTTSAPEHQWIGSALSEALSSRLLSAGSANVLSQRQWSAVLRERNVAAVVVRGEDDARFVARQLGADQVLIGTYTATWPEVRIQLHRLAATGGRPLATAEVSGRIEDLPALEEKLAKGVFTGPLGKAAQGRAAPKSVYAWHALARCRDALSLQSIGPRAQPWLPPAFVETAVSACEEAERLDRGLVEATAFRAFGKHLLGDAKQGHALAQKALAQRKVPGWPDLIAAYTTLRAGKAEAAEQILTRAIQQRPGFLHARTMLGESLLERGKLTEAKAVFEAALKDVPRQPWVMVQLSKVLAAEGDIDGAIQRVDDALALAPDDAVLLMEKGSRYIDGKRYDEAEKALRAAMAKDAGLAAAYVRLGYVYLEQDKLDLAGPILQKALFEADLESEARLRGYAHFDLAKLNARRGDREKAIDHIKKAVAAGLADKARYAEDKDLGAVVNDPALADLFPR